MTAARNGSILIVEEQAHWPNGHFSVRFAQLAEAYVDLGYDVDVLTSIGWHRSGEHQVPFSVHRFGPLATFLRRCVWRLHSTGGFRDDARQVALGLITAAAIRAHVRRMALTPDAIVMLGWQADPAVVAAAAGDGRWLLNHFQGPHGPDDWPSRQLARVIDTIVRRREARRRARGGCFRIAVAHEQRRNAWAKEVPHLDPVVLPIAGARDVTPEPDARAQLGLAATTRIALLFGDRHAKDRDTVLAAFTRLPEWTLVIAGRVGEGLESSANTVIMPDAVSDETRDRLFAAADLVVLSFTPGYRSNSGTLMDAISFGVPMVCTADAAAAAVVQQYRLGVPFDGGDVTSLIDAVQRAPDAIAAPDLAAARRELSNRAVARRQLLVVGILPDGG
jgi:glycosyltransferase involved in cell wall biosynthesis